MVKRPSKQPDNLWRRSNSANYWFSRAVPKDCEAATLATINAERAARSESPKRGIKVIQCSLGTPDKAEALRRARRKNVELDALWYGAPSLPLDPKAVAVEVGYEKVLAALDQHRRAIPDDDKAYLQHLAQRETELRRLTRRLQDGATESWEAVADRSIAKRGLDIAKGTDAYAAFVETIAQASIDAVAVFNRRNAGELDAEPRSDVVKQAKATAANTAKDGESISELYDSYAKWRCEPGRKRRRTAETFQQDRVAVELFTEFVGRKRAVGTITKDEARAFRAMLAEFPASRGKNPKLAKGTIQECIAMAKRDGLKVMSLTTQAKYLSIVSPFFDWLVSDGPVKVAENIFDGLHHKLERGENRRPSFSADQLNRLLTSPLFVGCAGDGGEHHPGSVVIMDWRYWVPLLCLFTGSRITEIAQLHVDDVAIKDGVPLVFLVHDEKSGQHLKNKKGRIAALHRHLIDAGFLDYWKGQVARAKRDGNPQLFPELEAGKRGLLGDEPARWFRRYLERIKIKSGADGIGPHSFRHTMADAMRAAGYMDAEFGQLVLGHSNNSITAAYGSIPQGTPARLETMMNAAFEAEPFKKVDFSGLALASALRAIAP